MLRSGRTASAAPKDSGEVVLDGLLISYVSSPLGTLGTSSWMPLTGYATTLSFRSLANPDLSLKARVSVGQERINGRAVVAQTESGKIENAITLFARPNPNEGFSILTLPP